MDNNETYLRDDQIIKPGDMVERNSVDDFGPEYKVKPGPDGQLSVTVRTGWKNYHVTDILPPERFHRHWRKVEASAVIRLLRLFKAKSKMRKQNAHGTYSRLIRTMVESQFRFQPDDFEIISKTVWVSFRRDEDFYGFVIQSQNDSAIKALEKHMKREPFWYHDVERGRIGDKPRRLYEGAYLLWEGLRVKITKMENDEFIACHQEYIQEEHTTKTRRIFKGLTREKLAYRQDLYLALVEIRNRLDALLPKREEPRVEWDRRDIEEGTLVLCGSCGEACWGKEGVWYAKDRNKQQLLLNCEKCGTPLSTNPTEDQMTAALAELEEQPADPLVLSKLRAIMGLGHQIKYAERIIKLAKIVVPKEEVQDA